MTYVTRYIPIKVNTDGTKEIGLESSSLIGAEKTLIDMLNRGIPYLSAQIDEFQTENIFDDSFHYGDTPASYLVKTHHYMIDALREIF